MSATHEPTKATRATVTSLSKFGIPRDQIAAHIGISEPTLRKHYAPELAEGKLQANLKVATNLYAFAMGIKGTEKAQVTAGIFIAKTQMGWRETLDVNHNVTDTDGAAAQLLAAVTRALAQGAEPSAPQPPQEPDRSRPN